MVFIADVGPEMEIPPFLRMRNDKVAKSLCTSIDQISHHYCACILTVQQNHSKLCQITRKFRTRF